VKQVEPDYRAPGEHGIRILVVDLRPAGHAVDRFSWPDNRSAKRLAALADADLGIASLGQPHAARITGRRSFASWLTVNSQVRPPFPEQARPAMLRSRRCGAIAVTMRASVVQQLLLDNVPAAVRRRTRYVPQALNFRR